ncbi:MAG: DUF6339 family protein, partial [Tissierellaceae bacterium]
MKVYIFTHESLDNLKINIDFNYKKYKECSNGWIKGYLGYDSFVEFNKSVGEFELDPQAKEIENTKILYTAMKNISDSEATDERLWA